MPVHASHVHRLTTGRVKRRERLVRVVAKVLVGGADQRGRRAVDAAERGARRHAHLTEGGGGRRTGRGIGEAARCARDGAEARREVSGAGGAADVEVPPADVDRARRRDLEVPEDVLARRLRQRGMSAVAPPGRTPFDRLHEGDVPLTLGAMSIACAQLVVFFSRSSDAEATSWPTKLLRPSVGAAAAYGRIVRAESMTVPDAPTVACASTEMKMRFPVIACAARLSA